MSIEYRLSQDPRLLEQYYRLRENCFREELGIPDFDGSEDEQDRKGHILLAIQDGECVGGARISPNPSMQGALGELNLTDKACCLWERFALDPAVRQLQIIRDFIAHLIEYTKLSGFQHALMLSSLRNARLYRQCHTTLDIGFRIHRRAPEYAQGTFEGLEHYLSVSNVQDCESLKMVA